MAVNVKIFKAIMKVMFFLFRRSILDQNRAVSFSEGWVSVSEKHYYLRTIHRAAFLLGYREVCKTKGGKKLHLAEVLQNEVLQKTTHSNKSCHPGNVVNAEPALMPRHSNVHM